MSIYVHPPINYPPQWRVLQKASDAFTCSALKKEKKSKSCCVLVPGSCERLALQQVINSRGPWKTRGSHFSNKDTIHGW